MSLFHVAPIGSRHWPANPPLNLEPRAAVYVYDYQGENQALTLANDKFADTLSMLQFSLIKLDSFLGEQLFVFVQK